MANLTHDYVTAFLDRHGNNPLFLSAAIRLYQRTHGFTDRDMALYMDMPLHRLNRLRLCLMPTAKHGDVVMKELDSIAAYTGADVVRLYGIVKFYRAAMN